MSQTKIKVLSLFTGGGGLDIGFHQAGFEAFACVEITPAFCETLQLNKPKYFSPDCQIINRDIRDVKCEEIKVDYCDFIIGGPPCQSFSAAGRRAGGVSGVNDQRGTLFEHYCRMISHFKPKGFLFENVRGILSANKRSDWNQILEKFSDLGYQIAFRILDAADYGAPQHRERLIMVGTKIGNHFLFPRPTHGPDSETKVPYVTCGEAIANLQDPNEQIHDYKGKYGARLKEVPPGMNYHYFTKELGYPNPVFAWRSRFSDFLYKADPNKSVKTIVAKLGAYSGPFHWKNRKFTVNEFKRLFTFPDDYQLAGGRNIAIQQLGNSVVPEFAKQLALAVVKQVFGRDNTVRLLSNETKLSFDGRKGEKARVTRQKRIIRQNAADLPLFACDTLRTDSELIKIKRDYFCTYPNWKTRLVNGLKYQSDEPCFKVVENRTNGSTVLCVARLSGGKASTHPMLEYVLRFHHPIGDGLSAITCKLYSEQEEDIVAAWDSIDDCLNKNTNYISLMDVFGHFTEPHPIFDLSLKLLLPMPGFLLKFAEYFSHFGRLAKDYPADLLKTFWSGNEDFNLVEVAKWLRSLRFDVRVYETNPNIKLGYFRCCYPFTVHVNKQVSVSWINRLNGNPIR